MKFHNIELHEKDPNKF